MERVLIEARTKSDARFLMSFSKRIGAKVVDIEELEDMVLGRLIEEGLKEPGFVSENEIMEILSK